MKLRGPYGSSQTGDQIIKACSRHDEYTWFFRPRLADCCAYPPSTDYISDDLRSAKIMRWLRPELGKPRALQEAPRQSAPSCWRAQPSPTCAVCEPTSVRATNPLLRRVCSLVVRQHYCR